jgi:hypothetical protein
LERLQLTFQHGDALFELADGAGLENGRDFGLRDGLTGIAL